LEDIKARDKSLLQYFMPRKADPKIAHKMGIVVKRLKIVSGEISEMKDNT